MSEENDVKDAASCLVVDQYKGNPDETIDEERKSNSSNSSSNNSWNCMEFIHSPSGNIYMNNVKSQPTSDFTKKEMPIIDMEAKLDIAMPKEKESTTHTPKEHRINPNQNLNGIQSITQNCSDLIIPRPYIARVEELESQLHQEKSRSLEKMKLLLKEQDKSHQLHRNLVLITAKEENLSKELKKKDHMLELKKKELEQLRNEIDSYKKNDSKHQKEITEKENTIVVLRNELTLQNLKPPTISDTFDAYRDYGQSLEHWKKQVRLSLFDSSSELTIEHRWKKILDELLEALPVLPQKMQNQKKSIAECDCNKAGTIQASENMYDELKMLRERYSSLKEMCQRQLRREKELQDIVATYRIDDNVSSLPPPPHEAVLSKYRSRYPQNNIDQIRIKSSQQLADLHRRVETPKQRKKKTQKHESNSSKGKKQDQNRIEYLKNAKSATSRVGKRNRNLIKQEARHRPWV